MAVIPFGEGEGDGAAGIADPALVEGLGFVEVTEGDVRQGSGEGGDGKGLAAADDEAAFGLEGFVGPGEVAMAHGDEGGVGAGGLAEVLGGGGEMGMEALDPGGVGIRGFREAREVGRAQEGDGENDGLGFAKGIAERDEVACGIRE